MAACSARGDQLMAAGNREQARALYVQALNDLHRAAGYDPSDKRVIGETAAVYRSLNLPQSALELMLSLAETYSLGDEPQEVLYLTGLDYMALQRYDDAATSLSTALTRGRPSRNCYTAWRRPSTAAVTLQKRLNRCNGH